MWSPVSLRLVNFRSFRDDTLNFERGATLVQGVNNYDDGSVSNGSGKSSLREAMCFALGLPTFTTVSTDLIRDGEKDSCVTLIMENSLSKRSLEISRKIFTRGSAKLSVKINGEDQGGMFSTVNEGNKYILETIGITSKDLINHYIVSKEKFKSFFTSSDKEIKELIARFSNFDKIDGVEDLVQGDIDILQESISKIDTRRSVLSGKLEQLNEDLKKEASKDSIEERKEAMDTINGMISTKREEIEAISKEISVLNDNIEVLTGNTILLKEEEKAERKRLEALEDVSFKKEIEAIKGQQDEVNDLLADVKETIRGLEKSREEHNHLKVDLELVIAGKATCPECGKEFLPEKGGDEAITLESALQNLPIVEQGLSSIRQEIDSYTSDMGDLDVLLKDLDAQMEGFRSKIAEYNIKKEELSDAVYLAHKKVESAEMAEDTNSTNILRLNKKIHELEQDIKRDEEARDLLDGEGYENSRIKEIEDNMSKIMGDVDMVDDELERMNSDMYGLKQWVLRFQRFRSKLANEALETIEGHANMYLKKMKTNLSIELEGYRQNRDGSIREKITPVVLRNGVKEGSGGFKKFSGGERAKIDYATTILAMQSLINNSSPTGGLEMNWVDEITEGTDSVGLENIARSVNELNGYSLITSHVTHDKPDIRILTVEKGTDSISNIRR